MLAVPTQQTENGPNWVLGEVPEVPLGDRQAAVKVHAAGLNRADLLALEGAYRPNPALGPGGGDGVAGLEMAGVVEALGPGAGGVEIGQRVMAMVAGGFAERVVVDDRLLLPVPARLDLVEAGALPVTLVTVYDALVQAGFQPGRTLLILGASSGVGVMAAQVGRALGAARVFGTSTRDDKLGRLQLDLGVNTRSADLAETLLDATAGRGADTVIDMLGGAVLSSALAAMAVGGTAIQVGRMAGTHANIDLGVLAARRLRLIGTTFRGRTVEELVTLMASVRRALPRLTSYLQPVIEEVLPLSEAAVAAEHMKAGRVLGKIVLTT